MLNLDLGVINDANTLALQRMVLTRYDFATLPFLSFKVFVDSFAKTFICSPFLDPVVTLDLIGKFVRITQTQGLNNHKTLLVR
jgi:hypothetical protein